VSGLLEAVYTTDGVGTVVSIDRDGVAAVLLVIDSK